MCLAVPGEIIEILYNENEPLMAKVSFGGTIIHVCLDLVPEAKIGDFVIVHVGFALSVIDRADAETTLNLFDELKSAGEML